MIKLTKSEKYFTKNVFLIFVCMYLFSCSSNKEELNFKVYNDYYPLQINKSITYSLDSTLFIINNGRDSVVRRYRIRDLIEAQITDNQNRTSYRIRRFIRNLTGDTSWRDLQTLVVTPVENGVEYVENNLRFIRLKNPIRDGFNWKGNSYIETNSTGLQFYNNWDYTYQSVDASLTLNGINFANTITVLQSDNNEGNQSNISIFSSKVYSIEKFAKGVGLVFKDFTYWEYQPNSSNPSIYGSRTGYGIKLTYISSN